MTRSALILGSAALILLACAAAPGLAEGHPAGVTVQDPDPTGTWIMTSDTNGKLGKLEIDTKQGTVTFTDAKGRATKGKIAPREIGGGWSYTLDDGKRGYIAQVDGKWNFVQQLPGFDVGTLTK